MGNQVVEVLQKFDTASMADPVLVIAVPKISFDWVPQRSAVRGPQIVEQLVEVPTVLRKLPSRSLTFQFLGVVVVS